MKTLISSLFLWFACLHLALAADITPNDLPAVVKKSLEQNAPGCVVERVKREDDLYVIQVKKGDQERELRIADDGVPASIEIALNEAPVAVQKAIQEQTAQGKVEFIAKTFAGKETGFDVDMRTTDGLQRSFEVNSRGKLTSIQLAEKDVPANIAKTIEAHRAGARLLGVYKLLEEGQVSYQADLEKDGKIKDLVVTPDGKLESMQFLLAEVPSEVQKTIKEKIGPGKILRIDKVFEKDGELFAVEGRKNAKTFNFSVGPKGRFLGMDE